ncbi:MAG: L,D-transpeptidase [Pseudomonadota bacterium]
MVIDKAKKNLVLFGNGEQVAEFPAAFGIDPDSDKYKTRDGATPEGLYFITYKKLESRFHRFLGISYPNIANAVRGLGQGVISLMEYKRIYQAVQKSGRIPCDTGLGCGIGIHGGGVFRYFGGTRETDWTEGCIALNNNDMEKVFDLCKSGDPVIIFNSRRNLCGIIRPFTHIKDIGNNGAPIPADGIRTYQIEIPTFLGRMILTVEEGKDYGRSMHVRVYKDDAREQPLLVLVDRNADGHICAMDSVSGPLADEKSPDATYARVREAVISALSRGEILDSL